MSKNLVFGEKAKNTTFKLYSWEKALVRAYLKLIRDRKKQEILVKKEKKNDARRNSKSKGNKLG